jgi:hypothetical protein
MPLQLLAACFFCYLSRKRKREDKLLEEAKERDIAEERRKRIERIKKDDIRKKKIKEEIERKKKEKIIRGLEEVKEMILQKEKEKLKEGVRTLESIFQKKENYIHLETINERIIVALIDGLIVSVGVYVEGDKWKATKAEPYEWKGKKRLKVSEILSYWKKKNIPLPQKNRKIIMKRIKNTLKQIILKKENIKYDEYDNDYDNIVVEVLEGEYAGKYKIEIDLPKTEGNFCFMEVFPLVPSEDNEPGTDYLTIIRKILKI